MQIFGVSYETEKLPNIMNPSLNYLKTAIIGKTCSDDWVDFFLLF